MSTSSTLEERRREAPGAAPEAAPPEAPGSALDDAAQAAQAIATLAQDAARMGVAWAEVAKAEVSVAKLSAGRLVAGVLVAIVLVFGLWLFACLAFGYWLATVLLRADLAMAIVAGLNLLLMVALILAMRRWWRAMLMPYSRAALSSMIRALS